MENKTTPQTVSFVTLEKLPELKGRKYDILAENLIHSLRPSNIIVSNESIKRNFNLWRVMVLLDKDGFIEKITQDVEVGCDGFLDGNSMLLNMEGFTQRELKFRAWNPSKGMYYFDIGQVFPADSIVTEFVGLKDIDGEDIYEGDIVSYSGIDNEDRYERKSVVYFEKGKLFPFCEYLGESSGTLLISSIDLKSLKIIGNVFISEQ